MKVPNLVGLPLEEAKEVLKSPGLVLGKVSKRKSTSPPDTVISQSIKVDEGVEPETAIDLVLAEKEKKKRKKTVGVREIEGIGNVYSARLEKSDIKTLNKLASSPSSKIAEATGVSEKMAETWKAMATIHDEDMGRNGAELLVKSGDIRSVDDLKKADTEELYGKLDRAIKLHKVRVPLEFTLKKEDVARWVKKAKDER
ncbi:MAG: PASTA domain protein [Candidatus Syntrophoarchaeum sp. GoM_oil]|nr:MAG: PASTA domain protein [Candidatus Syntrophoarchaeum sp. GoM_oil]